MSKPQQPPFPNKYNARLVAQTDAKPCTICFKPATTVLLAENNLDFFYTCVQHLLDAQFASPIPSEEYTELKKTVDNLTQKVDTLKKEVDAAKPYLWGISTYWSKDKPTETSKLSDKDKSKSNGTESENNKQKEGEKGGGTSGHKYETLKKQLNTTETELNNKQDELKNFKFKKYTLNQQVYRNRLMSHQKKKYNKERSEKIQQAGFFPSAPNHSIS
ncbi:hypothetical protein CANMA_003048 [Candida margitis]|uniref:uncharacterized protein n=1 Tax=Candida margitis TaxID=1775924 RepID=UPI0022268CDA|nr:uncharacterized protein CANMA_003048 [Candida margitis]KAI5967405.1 hypothetical protein CANMA_003048 [Candida margitis]